jgi:hypothetical protein
MEENHQTWSRGCTLAAEALGAQVLVGGQRRIRVR